MSAKMSSSESVTDFPMIVDGQKLLTWSAQLNAQAYKAAMRCHIEVLGFMKDRFEQDLRLMDDVLGRSDLLGVFEAWNDFLQKSATEYAAETNKLAAIGSKIGAEAARGARRQAEARSGDGSTRGAG